MTDEAQTPTLTPPPKRKYVWKITPEQKAELMRTRVDHMQRGARAKRAALKQTT